MDNYLFAFQLSTIRAIIKSSHILLYYQDINFD